jgi:hypothetical protein
MESKRAARAAGPPAIPTHPRASPQQPSAPPRIPTTSIKSGYVLGEVYFLEDTESEDAKLPRERGTPNPGRSEPEISFANYFY